MPSLVNLGLLGLPFVQLKGKGKKGRTLFN